jgi:hypothetical protein
MRPTSFALKELTAAEEKKIAAHVKKSGELRARPGRFAGHPTARP